MKRILFVLDAFGFFGGPERRAFRLALGLKRLGYEVYIASIMKVDVSVEQRSKEHGIDVLRVTEEHNRALRSYRVDVFLKMRRMIDRLNPDIIFTFEFLADYTTKMALLGKKSEIFTFIGSTEWKWENKRHRRIAMRRFVGKSRLYIVNSIRVRDSLLRVLPFAFEKVRVLYNPVDTGLFRPLSDGVRFTTRGRFGIGRDEFVVGSVVRFYNPKGADVLIGAFAESAVDGKLILIGDGSKRKMLENMVKNFNIESRVLFAGAMEATPELYSMFDIAVVPSQKGGFDNVVIEAMACGVPTVATKATGIGEIARSGEHLIITDTDAPSLAAGMTKLYRDPSLADRIGISGRKLVVERLDLEKICNKLADWVENG